VEWLQPYTEDAIKELGAQGVEDLLVVPISFVSEHIETLQEIDIEYREIAEHSGIHNFRRVPASTAIHYLLLRSRSVLQASPCLKTVPSDADEKKVKKCTPKSVGSGAWQVQLKCGMAVSLWLVLLRCW